MGWVFVGCVTQGWGFACSLFVLSPVPLVASRRFLGHGKARRQGCLLQKNFFCWLPWEAKKIFCPLTYKRRHAHLAAWRRQGRELQSWASVPLVLSFVRRERSKKGPFFLCFFVTKIGKKDCDFNDTRRGEPCR